MGRYYTDLFESSEDYGNQYFAHSGVQGMKWGVRRYQNEDGSLTEEGRIHYGVGKRVSRALSNTIHDSRMKKARKKKAKALEKARAEKKKKAEAEKKRQAELEKYNLSDKATKTAKKLDEMSDVEVFNALKRLRNEKAIRDMATQETKDWNAAHPSDIDKVIKTINTVSDVVVKMEPGITAATKIAKSLNSLSNSGNSNNNNKGNNNSNSGKDNKNKDNKNSGNKDTLSMSIIKGASGYSASDVPASNSNNMDTIGPILKSWGLD